MATAAPALVTVRGSTLSGVPFTWNRPADRVARSAALGSRRSRRAHLAGAAK